MLKELIRRNTPSPRIVVADELDVLNRFKQFLTGEERAAFEDLISQCTLHASEVECTTSPVREIPLLLLMILAQHKRLAILEKRQRMCTLPDKSKSKRSIASSCGAWSYALEESTPQRDSRSKMPEGRGNRNYPNGGLSGSEGAGHSQEASRSNKRTMQIVCRQAEED